MKSNLSWHIFKAFAIPAFCLLAALTGRSQTITSNPQNGATGVSPSAAVTFTFSTAVDPSVTSVTFYSTTPFANYEVTTNWSGGNTIVTCTPTTPFADNATISWVVLVNAGQIPVFAQGSFSTGTGGGGGGGGSGTNATTTMAVGKLYFYEQTNSSPPTIMTNLAYGFVAEVALASNRVASAATVTVPGTSSPISLNQNFGTRETFFFFDYNNTNQTAFEAAYPEGGYAFNLTGSNLQATVTLPTTMAQPNAPHISNWTAAQTVDATKAFAVTWDAFQGGTASDYIGLSLSDDSGEVFHTPYPGTNGVLTGTATSATIPAGTLKANDNYTADIVFYRFMTTSNAIYATVAYRASETQFPLNTIGSASTVPAVSNPVWSAGAIAFDVATSPNQALKVRFSTNCSLPINQWQTILTTNSPGTSVHIAIPPQAGTDGFFRLQNGP